METAMMTNMTKKRSVTPMPSKPLPVKKTESFAVGVSQSNYWIVTALAQAKGMNRTVVLDKMIEHYVQTVLAK
jgi:hypothetical protein